MLPSEQEQATPKVLTKRTNSGLQKNYQRDLASISLMPSDEELLRAVLEVEEDLRTYSSQDSSTPLDFDQKRANKQRRLVCESTEEDEELLRALVEWGEKEEYLSTYSSQDSSTPPDFDQTSSDSQQVSSSPSNGIIQAILPSEQEQATTRRLRKRSASGFQNNYQQSLESSSLMPSDEELLRALSEVEEEYLRTQSSQDSSSPAVSSQEGSDSQQVFSSPSSGIVEEDEELLRAVVEVEEEYLRTQSSQDSSSPAVSSQEGSDSQQVFSPLSSGVIESEKPGDSFKGFSYRHLITPEDHQRHLIGAIHSAKSSLLITSYTFSADMSEGTDLFEAIHAACDRGVRVYVYANEIRLGKRERDSLSRLKNLSFDEVKVHSKLLVVDNKQITCSSYNWLEKPWGVVSQNASLILEGGELKPVVDRIWHVLEKYRTVDFSQHSFRNVETTLRSLPSLNFQFKHPEDSFELLNTPYKHKEIFEDCFKQAQRQLTICAPFITGSKGFLENSVLPKSLLLPFLKSGKKLHILCRADDERIDFLTTYLAKLLSGPNIGLRENITITRVKGLHRKSFFVDDNLYIEGSYNWLSSARTLDDPCYLMETSIRFTGGWAKELIRGFPGSLSLH